MARANFEKLRVYELSERLADTIWDVVLKWKRLPQDTIGKQIIRSADSIGANITEGVGRGSFQDNRRFVRMAEGLSTRPSIGCGDPMCETSLQQTKYRSSSPWWMSWAPNSIRT